ncbi:MAG: NADH-quinone oxidoreductase subunit B [Candidatus Limnocylindrales bacterium]
MGLETVFGHSCLTTRLDAAVNWGRKYSFFQYPFVTACCGMEFMSAWASTYDIARFGAEYPRFSPRQADVLIVAGTLTTKMAGPLIRLWEQMPEPKWCVALGDCTVSGGRYKRSYSVVQGIDRVMPVDVYIPGCPPRPEGLIYGMLQLGQLVKDRRGHWDEREIGPTVPDDI